MSGVKYTTATPGLFANALIVHVTLFTEFITHSLVQALGGRSSP